MAALQALGRSHVSSVLIDDSPLNSWSCSPPFALTFLDSGAHYLELQSTKKRSLPVSSRSSTARNVAFGVPSATCA